jgi:hypothetical protein
MEAYVFCETAVKEKPIVSTQLLEKAIGMDKTSLPTLLTRDEKNQLMSLLYGTFSNHSPLYKLLGWCWDMRSCLRRYLVSFHHDRNIFHTYFAPDKTSIQATLSNVAEIVETK